MSTPAHAMRTDGNENPFEVAKRAQQASPIGFRPLGRTGVEVSELCLGTLMLGSWGNADDEDGVRIIRRALDSGINFIDTADVYSYGEAELIVAKALSGGLRDNVVLATKGQHPMGPDRNQRGNSRRWITRAVEDSLHRLNTDWIDLYQIHRPEPGTDIDETLGVLSDLVHAGKIRTIGCSTFPAHSIVESLWVADHRGRERFWCEQPPYNMLLRGIETDVLPVCQQYGMGAIIWSPLASGWLSGRYRLGRPAPKSARQSLLPRLYDLSLPVNQRKLEAVEQLALLAEEAGLSLIQMAIAFTLSHPGVTSAIIGPRTCEHLDSQLAAIGVSLTPDVLDRIDEIVAPGTNLSPVDLSRPNPALAASVRRR